jgi:hypothetical protein
MFKKRQTPRAFIWNPQNFLLIADRAQGPPSVHFSVFQTSVRGNFTLFDLEIWRTHPYLYNSSLFHLSRKAEGNGPMKP